VEIGLSSLPANAGHGDVKQPSPRAIAMPINGWVRGMSVELVDAQGREVPQRVLHHLNVIMPERRELFSQIMLRIGAAGPETKPWELPFFLGYRLHPGDSVLFTAMVHNPTPNPLDGVRIRVKLDYTPADIVVPLLGIHPVYLDVTPPAGFHSFDLPPGRSSASWEGRPGHPGAAPGRGRSPAPVWDGARLVDVTANEVLWEARPELGFGRVVEGMPIKYFLPLGLKLDPDHVYRLTAFYDNPTGQVIPGGGMGAWGASFSRAWGRPGRHRPTTIRSIARTSASPSAPSPTTIRKGTRTSRCSRIQARHTSALDRQRVEGRSVWGSEPLVPGEAYPEVEVLLGVHAAGAQRVVVAARQEQRHVRLDRIGEPRLGSEAEMRVGLMDRVEPMSRRCSMMYTPTSAPMNGRTPPGLPRKYETFANSGKELM
jgi:hypothetical protein